MRRLWNIYSIYCTESMMTDKNDAEIYNTITANNHNEYDKKEFSDDASYASYCRQID